MSKTFSKTGWNGGMGGMKSGRVAWGGMGWHGRVQPIYQSNNPEKQGDYRACHPCHPIWKLWLYSLIFGEPYLIPSYAVSGLAQQKSPPGIASRAGLRRGLTLPDRSILP